MARLGWIGLGAMGAPMAAVAARAGLAPVAYDIDPGRAEALAGDGVEAAATAADAARDADVLVLMVATAGQVEGVLLGDGGALEALPSGAVVMVMATVGPAAVERWARRSPSTTSSSWTPRCRAASRARARVTW